MFLVFNSKSLRLMFVSLSIVKNTQIIVCAIFYILPSLGLYFPYLPSLEPYDLFFHNFFLEVKQSFLYSSTSLEISYYYYNPLTPLSSNFPNCCPSHTRVYLPLIHGYALIKHGYANLGRTHDHVSHITLACIHSQFNTFVVPT